MNPVLEGFAQFADDIFSVTPPDAPGASFCGAMFTAGGQRFPAGAADVDPHRARVRCLGEIAETLAQFAPLAELQSAPAGTGLDAGEQLAMNLLAGGGDGPWLAATRLSDGCSTAIPARLCLRQNEEVASIASSLGCAAGETRLGAIRSALFELIERDAVALWWHGANPPLTIPDSGLEQAKMLLAQARQGNSGRKVRFLALQSICDVPVVCAMSCDAGGTAVALGFGAAETYATAAVKSLMELLQMETGNRIVAMKARRMGAANLSTADAELWLRLTILDDAMPPFQAEASVQYMPDLAMEDMAVTLASEGVQVYAVDLFRIPDLPVVKLVAPKLQPLPGQSETERLACAKKTHLERLRHFPKVAVL